MTMGNENKAEKWKGKENTQYQNEVGTIVRQIVYSHKKIVGLMLERKDSDGNVVNEFVYDKVEVTNKKEFAVVNEYKRLQTEFNECSCSDVMKIRAKSCLLRCFCTAVVDDYRNSVKNYYNICYDLLDSLKSSIVINMFKTQIILIVFAILFSLVLQERFENITDYIYAANLGLIGAFVMICFNYGTIHVGNMESISQLTWRYGAKLLCGAIFGFVILLFLKANLIMPEIAGNFYVQMVCSFVAGFETKWVPRIASSFTNKTENSSD